jgi:hypothetical protein
MSLASLGFGLRFPPGEVKKETENRRKISWDDLYIRVALNYSVLMTNADLMLWI